MAIIYINKQPAAVDTSNVIPFPDTQAASMRQATSNKQQARSKSESPGFCNPLHQVHVQVKQLVLQYTRSVKVNADFRKNSVRSYYHIHTRDSLSAIAQG